ncbi:hypothetical protein [Luteolibacter sp. LG18]|uniref:hypothetical protein n=1 Tax=Luteolibacter sp. LG18 TaxID=2819286 RepID=UPI002B318813|nr:hypothetical protein llg_29430 [Luteolibacter sp. LG18]
MKPRLILCTLLFGAPTCFAQDLKPKPADRERDRAIDAFQRLDSGNRPKTNEVTVVLDDAETPPIPPVVKPQGEPLDDEAMSKPVETKAPKPSEPKVDKPVEDANGTPVLVTGKPPEDAKLLVDELPPAPEKPEKGVTVRVVDVQGGKGPIDPNQIKLKFPFPAKPLAAPPTGWVFDASGNAPAFNKEVELAPGTKIALNIRPHVLVPLADGKEVFSVNEPGFDPALGYSQPGAVGGILAKSVAQLDDDSKHLGDAIDRLQQLLASLPAPEPEPVPPVATPVKEPTSPKKR